LRVTQAIAMSSITSKLLHAVTDPFAAPLTAVDLFAGAGGFSLGCARAGFDIVLANEFSVDAEATYRFNHRSGDDDGLFPDRPTLPTAAAMRKYRAEVRANMMAERKRGGMDGGMRGGDIRKVLTTEWLLEWKAQFPYGIDLLVAGPPCQGFSSAGRRDEDDTRNHLVLEALRVIRVLRPRVVIIENVPGMLERHPQLVAQVGKALTRKGTGEYAVRAELVHGEKLGVPQTRRRMLIVGVRRDLLSGDATSRLSALLFPTGCPVSRPNDATKLGQIVDRGTQLTASMVLGDVELRPHVYGRASRWTAEYGGAAEVNQFVREIRTPRDLYLSGQLARTNFVTEYANHEASEHESHVARRMSHLRKAASSSQDARAHRCSSAWLRSRFVGQYPDLDTKKASQRVLLADEWPMLTVTSLPDDIVHFSCDRIPTVREVARLQTFPDWFEFHGVRTTGGDRRVAGVFVPQFTQVANAVPPRLAHAVAGRIRQFLARVDVDSSCQFELDGGDYVSPNKAGTAHHQQLATLNSVLQRLRS
jgi:DNA (cytosine-5)-methyltransferase 1